MSQNRFRHYDGQANHRDRSMPTDQQAHFRELFDKLDINKDGRVEVDELARILKGANKAIDQKDVQVAVSCSCIASPQRRHRHRPFQRKQFQQYTTGTAQ